MLIHATLYGGYNGLYEYDDHLWLFLFWLIGERQTTGFGVAVG